MRSEWSCELDSGAKFILAELELGCSLKVSQTQSTHTCLLASDWLVLKLGSEVRCTGGTSHLTCVYMCRRC